VRGPHEAQRNARWPFPDFAALHQRYGLTGRRLPDRPVKPGDDNEVWVELGDKPFEHIQAKRRLVSIDGECPSCADRPRRFVQDVRLQG